jgi:hypothetical protein
VVTTWHPKGCWRCGWKVHPEQAQKGNTKVRPSGMYNGAGNGGFWCNVCLRERPALGGDHYRQPNLRGEVEQTMVEHIELGWRVWRELTGRDRDSDWIVRNRCREAGHDPMWGGVPRSVVEQTDPGGQIRLAL